MGLFKTYSKSKWSFVASLSVTRFELLNANTVMGFCGFCGFCGFENFKLDPLHLKGNGIFKIHNVGENEINAKLSGILK